MNVQNTTAHNYSRQLRQEPQKRQIGFGATPRQIINAVETVTLCSGKTQFLSQIAGFFGSLQRKLKKLPGAPAEYIYKLGEKNPIPETLKKVEINGITLANIDNALNKNPFKCSPNATCSCGEGMTRGAFATDLLKSLGVENPEVIKITKKRGN